MPMEKSKMKDPIDTKLKAEIDEIMQNVKNILKKIEAHYPIKDEATEQNQDQQSNWSPRSES